MDYWQWNKKKKAKKKKRALWHSARYFIHFPFNCLKSFHIVFGPPLPDLSFLPHPFPPSPLQPLSAPVALEEGWLLPPTQPPMYSHCWGAAHCSDAEKVMRPQSGSKWGFPGSSLIVIIQGVFLKALTIFQNLIAVCWLSFPPQYEL